MKIAGLKLHKVNRIGKDEETIKRAENKLRRLEELENEFKEKMRKEK